MTRVMRATLVLLLLAGTAAAMTVEPEAVKFTKPPAATTVGEKTTISFAVSGKTDVEVAILDARGTVVRHLAAGVLGGENTPAPLVKRTLSQSLVWDGRDDAGTPAPKGAYTVRVCLGLQARFDRIMGWAPTALGSIRSLAVGPDGELFVLSLAHRYHSGDSSPTCQVFDRSGAYLRTIMPYPAHLPEERLEPFGRITLGDRTIPFVHHGENYIIYPRLKEPWRQGMIATPDGRLVFLSAPGRGGYHQPTVNRFFAITTDGGAPKRGGLFGPLLVRDGYGPVCLSQSPDGATFYASGIHSGFIKNPRPHHVVYRFSWTDDQVEPFVGRPFSPGNSPYHLNDPRGIAVDALGQIYVADRGNDRIAVFRSDGSFLNSIDVPDPDFIAVNRETGAVYVLSGRPAGTLIKLTGHRRPRELARLTMRRMMRDDRWIHGLVMAVDDKAKPPLIWLASPTSYHRFGLLRIEDKGLMFGEPREITDYGNALGLHGSPGHLSVDREREEVYASTTGRTYRFNGRTGEWSVFKKYGEGDLWVVGADGLIYGHHNSPLKQVVSRWTRDLEPVPFEKTGTNTVRVPGSIHLKARGLTAGRDGTIYVMREVRNHRVNEVRVIAPDGSIKHTGLISALTGGASSVRVDNAGNVYAADCSRPAGQTIPPGLKGLMPEDKRLSTGAINWYPVIYGSVVKFPPTGGGITREETPGAVRIVTGYDSPRWRTGALWQWAGLSPIPTFAGDGGQRKAVYCGCERASFDVDDFGRSFLPDAARFTVHVLDAAGNHLLRFGTYGNADAGVGGVSQSALNPAPDITFAWPISVAVSDEAAYVGDLVNRRIVRVKLGYKKSMTCSVEVK